MRAPARPSSGMRKKRLEWSSLAERDYQEAIAYLLGEAGEQGALKFVERIEKAQRLIAAHPDIGTPGRRAGTRELPAAHTGHTLVYRNTVSKIQIVRLWHQRRDVDLSATTQGRESSK